MVAESNAPAGFATVTKILVTNLSGTATSTILSADFNGGTQVLLVDIADAASNTFDINIWKDAGNTDAVYCSISTKGVMSPSFANVLNSTVIPAEL